MVYFYISYHLSIQNLQGVLRVKITSLIKLLHLKTKRSTVHEPTFPVEAKNVIFLKQDQLSFLLQLKRI